MSKQHPYIETLASHLAARRIGRRDFLRTATLLGLSASAAYAMAAKNTGIPFVSDAAAGSLPKGGSIAIAMPAPDLSHPARYSAGPDSTCARQSLEYLTLTGTDNVTRPYLLESWEASDDLKTWTLRVRKDVKWRKGRTFNADDVIWNIRLRLDPATGSSVLGLMADYMMKDVESNGQKTQQLWDSNAIEKVDDYTVRLHLRVPHLAVPEDLFHYPFAMLDPEENGVFGVGANGTGPFEMVEYERARIAAFKANKNYWGTGPYLDGLTFKDTGDDPAARVAALLSGQVVGMEQASVEMLPQLSKIDRLRPYEVHTANTVLVRGKVTAKPFDDPRIMKAFRLATNSAKTVTIALGGHGAPGEHHHVAPVHPEYAKSPMNQDIAAAKALLAEAGYPNGIDIKLTSPKDPSWSNLGVQAMVQQWKASGIRATIEPLPTQQFWDVWDKVPIGATWWLHRPLGIMVYNLAYRTKSVWNESSISNQEFDDLLTQANGILDPKKRSEVFAKLEKIMQDVGPIVHPLWVNAFTFYDKKVLGFKMHPTLYVFGQQLALQA
jgi:peptide/nickel transport system substrate-binding protein